MTNNTDENEDFDVVPTSRKALEPIVDEMPEGSWENLLLDTNDLNLQLTLLKQDTNHWFVGLDYYKDEIEHIFKTFLLQLEDAAGHLSEDEDDNIKSILLKLLSKDLPNNNTPMPAKPRDFVFPWPTINVPPSKMSDPGYAEDWNNMSPLKIFGYTVGKTNGWDKQTRQRFLTDFMNYDLPNIVTDTYGDYYGEPISVERLKATAQLFASLITSAKRKRGNSMRYAIADWSDDLEFLKATYYEGMGLKFYSWPSTTQR